MKFEKIHKQYYVNDRYIQARTLEAIFSELFPAENWERVKADLVATGVANVEITTADTTPEIRNVKKDEAAKPAEPQASLIVYGTLQIPLDALGDMIRKFGAPKLTVDIHGV